MQSQRIFPRAFSACRGARRVCPARVATVLTVALIVAGATAAVGLSIFRPFDDDSVDLQSAPPNLMLSTIGSALVPVIAPPDDTNMSLDPSIATHDQALVV